jgi:hypothetical protein
MGKLLQRLREEQAQEDRSAVADIVSPSNDDRLMAPGAGGNWLLQ